MVITTSMLGGSVASCTPLISAWSRCIVGLLTHAAEAMASSTTVMRAGEGEGATPLVYAQGTQRAVWIGRQSPDDPVSRVERLDGPAVSCVDADVSGPPENIAGADLV